MQSFSTDLQISFGTLESVLSRYQRIADDKRTAFQARLKNFHRLGFPSDLETVKGKPTQYFPHHVLMMALAIELSQLGIPPDRVIKLILRNIGHVAVAISYSVKELLKSNMSLSEKWSGNPKSFFLCADPVALQSLMGELNPHEELFFYSEEKSLANRITEFTLGSSARLAVVNTTSLVDFITPFDDIRAPFLKALARWADKQPMFQKD